MTDTQSTVDYGMFNSYLDRQVHESVLEQLKVIERRTRDDLLNAPDRSLLLDDIQWVQDRVKRRNRTAMFSTETINFIREALLKGQAQSEDAPLPKGEVWYGLLIVGRSDGRTNDAGFWVTDKEQRDARLKDLRDVSDEFEYVAIRKVTEYERG